MAIQQKPKICKGINNAKGFGCGELSDKRTFGLCPVCKYQWATTTDKGKIWFETQIAFKKKKNIKEDNKKSRDFKSKFKLDNMSADKYRSTYLQPVINKIARLIDFGHPCIATGNFGKMNGGHYISVGANRTICLNLHNIFIQSFASNHWKSGDPLKYQNGLIETFGTEYFDYINSLSQHKPLNLSKEDMMVIKDNALKICKELEQDEVVRTANERIQLRNQVNIALGIYDSRFCEFKK